MAYRFKGQDYDTLQQALAAGATSETVEGKQDKIDFLAYENAQKAKPASPAVTGLQEARPSSSIGTGGSGASDSGMGGSEVSGAPLMNYAGVNAGRQNLGQRTPSPIEALLRVMTY